LNGRRPRPGGVVCRPDDEVLAQPPLNAATNSATAAADRNVLIGPPRGVSYSIRPADIRCDPINAVPPGFHRMCGARERLLYDYVSRRRRDSVVGSTVGSAFFVAPCVSVDSRSRLSRPSTAGTATTRRSEDARR